MDQKEQDEVDKLIQQEEEEISYTEIMDNLLLNDEMIITVDPELEVIIKNGLKNLKSRQNAKLREEGLPPDPAVLDFLSYPSKSFEGCIDLHISLKKKGTFKIKKLTIPSEEF